ncbi:MAG: hypothetical protein Q9181_005087 [Wetmoreana brouardii]
MASDPLEEVLQLENTFYKEGYDLGVQDGTRIGRIEGRLFGLEKGFEKYATMGKLHGRSVIWSGRLASAPKAYDNDVHSTALPPGAPCKQSQDGDGEAQKTTNVSLDPTSLLPLLPQNPRLEKHIRTLYALTEPASLSTDNSEDAVSDFDDRLRRAEGKVKIIEKLVDEEFISDSALDAGSAAEIDFTSRSSQQSPAKGDGGIEDISILQARR